MTNSKNQIPLLELRGITKKFPGVLALDAVDLVVNQGEIHVILGENGAGKSTLIKTILGVEKADDGEMFWNGRLIKTSNIKESYDLGIAVIYQELSNIPCLSVAENMFLGNELHIKNLKWTVDRTLQIEKAKEALNKVGCDIDPTINVEKLGMGQKQLMEIARAIDRNAKLIIMDEPTSSLSRKEIEHLLDIMSQLKAQGISIVFITHKLDEAKKVGDIVTVLKDGRKVGTIKMEEVSEEQIIKMMVGRNLDEKYPKRQSKIGDIVFEVNELSSNKFKNVSFQVRKGELLGLFGLVGAGRTEVARGIFGADPITGGNISIEGKQLNITNPKEAIKSGIVLATENRKEEGLVLIHDVVENVTIPALEQFREAAGLLNQKSRMQKTLELTSFLNLRPQLPKRNAMNFSGGNQQKIVIAKWLLSQAKLFIFDEPTKGVDIGAKVEIYSIMNSLLEQGVSILMISSEMQEILGMSDRVLVMYEGRITGEFINDNSLSQERIMVAATGGKL